MDLTQFSLLLEQYNRLHLLLLHNQAVHKLGLTGASEGGGGIQLLMAELVYGHALLTSMSQCKPSSLRKTQRPL